MNDTIKDKKIYSLTDFRFILLIMWPQFLNLNLEIKHKLYLFSNNKEE